MHELFVTLCICKKVTHKRKSKAHLERMEGFLTKSCSVSGVIVLEVISMGWFRYTIMATQGICIDYTGC